MATKIIASVISDIVTDQRVLKECATFNSIGYDVLLIGRRSKNNFGLKELPFKYKRLWDPFKKGALMYSFFNFQLFFVLLFHKADILWANDLDTLLPNFLISRLKRIKLVYDSHEYFLLTVAKKTSRKVFGIIERKIFPRLKNVVTVNDSIKQVYEKQYGVPVIVIRNVPLKAISSSNVTVLEVFNEKKILLMQGIGLNENRGCEEAVETMQYLDDSYLLYFIGRGTILDKLHQKVSELQLERKVFFQGVLPYEEMMSYTRQAFLGLIFENIDFNDEHLFALPNKFFDYIKAGLPVLSTRAVEIEAIIERYKIGGLLEDLNPINIANKIKSIEADVTTYTKWKQNLPRAAAELNWENEEPTVVSFLKNLKQ